MEKGKIQVRQFPEPVEVTGPPAESWLAFYGLAKKEVVFQTRMENIRWRIEKGDGPWETTASFIVEGTVSVSENGDTRKFVKGLEIVVSLGLINYIGKQIGEDCRDLIPYIIEHEIFEIWTLTKKGIGEKLTPEQRHSLGRRREYFAAARDGKAQKLTRFHMAVNSFGLDEYKKAEEYAKRRFKNNKGQTSDYP